MTLTINGEAHEVRDGLTVAELLAQWQLEPRRVAVERNAELVTRATFADTALAEGDTLEIVTLVGGG